LISIREFRVLRQSQHFAARPVLGDVVRGEHGRRPLSFRVETPVPVPAADVEHALALEVDPGQLTLGESPGTPVVLGVGQIGAGDQSIAEVELVVPGDGVDLVLEG
jgi:hypothetical protein